MRYAIIGTGAVPGKAGVRVRFGDFGATWTRLSPRRTLVTNPKGGDHRRVFGSQHLYSGEATVSGRAKRIRSCADREWACFVLLP